MLIGNARVSKADGSQRLDLQRDALTAAGVETEAIYEDCASGKRDDRPGLEACLKALRACDTLVVWKLDWLGRDLAHLVAVVSGLADREVGLRVLAGQGAVIDSATATGRLVFAIFAALAEFEHELIRERTRAGLAAARERGRKGGRKFALTEAQVRLAQAAMKNRDTSVTDLAAELGIKPVTVYRYVGPDSNLREHGRRVLRAESPHRSWGRATELLERRLEVGVALLGLPGTREAVLRYRSQPVEGLRALVHGHHPVREVEYTSNRWNIDTGAGISHLNRLTVLEVNRAEFRSWTFDVDEIA